MFDDISNTLANYYRQYELVTCLYMFEPWEKKLINGLVMTILMLVIFSSYMYLPAYIQTLMQLISPLSLNDAPKTYAPLPQVQKMAMS